MKLMKKIGNAFLALSLLSAFSSCEVGLGSAVDLKAPVVRILSHQDNQAVADEFTIRGTASDNEAVSLISIDFADADIHYQIIPGMKIQKKTSASDEWITIEESEENKCEQKGKIWEWSVFVDTKDKRAGKEDNKFIFEVKARDKAGNTGKTASDQRTLIVDPSYPYVSIYKPELFSGTYEQVENDTGSYQLQDGNVISRIENGAITLMGRQSGAFTFRALKVELDNGELYSGCAKYNLGKGVDDIEKIDVKKDGEAYLGDPDPETITTYYSKTIEDADLREWSLTINPEEWAFNEAGISHNLNTGKHIIRIVTTSLSSANSWERKVIGYFVWWPEADKPWITASAGDTERKETGIFECYPGSNFPGSAQDDDGIKSLVSTVYKLNEDSDEYEKYEDTVNHELPATGAKYAAWTAKVPAENGKFKIEITVEDYTGNVTTLTKYFKTSDVSAPKIEITSPKDNSTSLLNAEGNITFTGSASDNGKLASFSMVWLNPALRSVPSNKIKYLTGEDPEWDTATEAGTTDRDGNKIFKFDTENASSYNLNKTFNLYSDFGIDGNTKQLVTQEFIFRAVDDSGTKSVKTITLTGDSITPKVDFDSITINGTTESLKDGNLPGFPNSCNGKTATITGTWSDEFTSTLKNTDKINEIEISWGDFKKTAAVNSDGTWTVNITSPSSGGTITAKLVDFGGNAKTVQSAASIETSALSLARIDCHEDDGAYNAGKVLNITLEFTKNTNVSGGIPTLVLNNGGTASYVEGSGSTSHVYKYTVGAGDKDVEKLSVTQINANGAQWCDSAALTSKLELTQAPAGANLDDTRTIKIDNTAPGVKSITALSSEGYYKAGASVLLMMEFTEDVTVSNAENLAVNFAHKNGSNTVKAASPNVTGSKYVLFTYEVKAGENAAVLTYNSISSTSVVVKDNAGNSLTSWNPVTAPSFAGIVVDTTTPAAPSFGSWAPDRVIFGEGTSFELSTTEKDIESQEYSLDNGQNWTPYTGKVTIANNGTYTVTARQTDKAGNVSSSAASKTFTVDKGELLTRITADTVNGTYSTKTDVNSVTGKIVFRKTVEIPAGATVTLNVKKGTHDTYKVCPIIECVSSACSASEFTFIYTIEEDDYVDADDGKLDVIDWSFDTVNVKYDAATVPVDISIQNISPDKRFNVNRDISIQTGIPKIEEVSFTGEGADAVLLVKYDRPIGKVGGDIVFEYDTDSNDFHVPAVLSATEYNEVKNDAVEAAYTPGTNGAIVSGTSIKNDTTTKYILKTDQSDTNTDLVSAFKAANKHKVTIPVISDQVEVVSSGRSLSGDTLQVTLGQAYALPVKGAQYTLTIDAGAVSDAVSNTSVVYEDSVKAEGVEKPEIRIVKPSYTVTGYGKTTKAEVKITEAQTATMYLSCRTPDADIKYGLNSRASTAVEVHSNPINVTTTKTSDITVPSEIGTLYTTAVSLGSNNAVKTAAAQGLKIAIAAQAEKETYKSEISYEYATRTVVKLQVTGQYRGGEDAYNKESGITENGSKLILRDLRPYIMGGDSPYGPNVIDTFPLAWGDPAKYRLMAGNYSTDTNMYGSWWWVSWDISATTYIGFVIGDVPSDGLENGPTRWIPADYAWVPVKDKYPLYPGETLVMASRAVGTSVFPMGAEFSWGLKKVVNRQ